MDIVMYSMTLVAVNPGAAPAPWAITPRSLIPLERAPGCKLCCTVWSPKSIASPLFLTFTKSIVTALVSPPAITNRLFVPFMSIAAPYCRASVRFPKSAALPGVSIATNERSSLEGSKITPVFSIDPAPPGLLPAVSVSPKSTASPKELIVR